MELKRRNKKKNRLSERKKQGEYCDKRISGFYATSGKIDFDFQMPADVC